MPPKVRIGENIFEDFRTIQNPQSQIQNRYGFFPSYQTGLKFEFISH